MGHMTVEAEELQTMKNSLEQLQEDLIKHYNSVQDLLDMMVSMGWKDNLFNKFKLVSDDLNEEFVPLNQAMGHFAGIKGTEAHLEIIIRELNPPKFN